MIGNDLIDFRVCRRYRPERWRAYWSKVLRPEECDAFVYAPNEPKAWLYWAAKESAWKIWFRRSAKRLLNPKAFCLSTIEWEGSQVSFRVEGPEQNYQGRASMDDTHLHAWVWSEAFGEAGTAKLKIASCEKNQLDQAALSSLPDHLLADQILRDPQGIPHFAKDGKPLNVPLSLSHHGSRAAFAYVYS
ncbi:MAG: 4'-phosphopantetheinyl transferase superfamily protein [Bacteroidota bacterium]